MDASFQRPQFEFVDDTEPTGDVLVCGLSSFGLAGLTATDYLVDQTALEQCGHATATASTITPFEDGTPRHPIRLYDSPDLTTTVLVSEVGVPRDASRPFSAALIEWTEAADIDEVVVLSGVPGPHGPDDHRTFYVATPDYRSARLGGASDGDGHADGAFDGDPSPMGSGYLDGVPASLLTDGIDSPLRVCVFVTPVHERIPDVDAALRLLETLAGVYDLTVDTGPLESFASDVQRHYADLAERIQRTDDDDRPEDRMYM